MKPKVSIIMPVYNGGQVLADTLRCLHAQTFLDFEVIFVDDGSDDGSCELLQEVVEADGRFLLLRQSHRGAGAARNYGFSAATGDYCLFSDCDDLYQPQALETLYRAALSAGADIVACNYAGLDASGKVHLQTGVQEELLPPGCSVFSYRDCPKEILRIAGTVVWNKLYRREFLLDNGLRFDELFTCNDLSFVSLSMACAQRITYCAEHLIHYRFPRLGNPKALADAAAAVESALRQLDALPHKNEIQKAVLRFGIDHSINALKKYAKDFSDPVTAAFYQKTHLRFQQESYLSYEPEELRNGRLYREFLTVRKHDYEAMKRLQSRRILVSMTSYPKRIGTVAKSLETIYTQTKKADEVLLWLAEEQFPGKEKDLPEELLQLVRENRLTIRWCDDLRSHKKYFYAFQEYPDELVITVDDDLRYSPDTISSLFASYLLYPNAVSAVRAHMMVLSGQKQLLPYGQWIQETDICIHSPSMQLMATSGSGTLFPPALFRKEFFDKKAIRETCLHADDLWLKAMQLVSDVPVVLARSYAQLHLLPEAQEDSLFDINVRRGQNDVQMDNILRWVDNTFGPGTFLKKITQPVCGADFLDLEAVTQQTERERRILRKHLGETRDNLEETTAALRQSDKVLTQTKAKLEKTEAKLKHTEDRLKRTQLKLKETEESKPIAQQLRALGAPLSRQRASGLTPMLLVKLLVYYLAWIPEKLLAAMMYYLENGMSHTLKHFCDKLLRRK